MDKKTKAQKKKLNNRIGIIFLSVAGFVFLVGIILMISFNQTRQNPENTLGNTAGNLLNKGLFCEKDGKIYFANPDDEGMLYVMDSDCSNIKKLYDDKVRYINVDDHYIYYARINNLKSDGGSMFTFYNTGLYRINRSGNPHLKTLSTSPSAALLLYGNKIFYQHYGDNNTLSLYSIGTDGKNDKQLSTEAIYPAGIYKGSLVYSGIEKTHDIMSLNLSSNAESTLLSGKTYNPIPTSDGIYYIDTNRYYIFFTDYSGKTKEILARSCCAFNISNDGRYLYYQTDREEKNYIGVLNLFSGNNEKIMDGNYECINVTSKYVFFNEFNTTTTYAYTTDGSKKLNLFKPGKK